MIKQKAYLLPENLDQISNLNMGFPVVFQLTVLLKPDFNCRNSFILSLADKVTTGI